LSTTAPDIRIQPITDDLLEACWQVRLRALRDHPDAFGQPYEEVADYDSDAVRHLYETFWVHRNNRVFGAFTTDDTLVGMIGVAGVYSLKMEHCAKIWGVYVAPEFRGMGISDQLLAAAIDYGRGMEGVLQLHLGVISTNAPAVRSYERAGFVRYGRIPRAYILNGVPKDSDLMVLMLDDYPPQGREV
jgi:RimJ/RimL family protein N-acetyltransferase